VRVDVPKGDVQVRGVAGADLRVARGDVRGADLTGAVRTDVLSGDVALRRVAGDLQLDVTSGDVTLREIEGEIAVDTKSGDVTVAQARSRALRVRALSGDVARDLRTLRGVVNGPGATVRLQATRGDVEIRGG